MTVRFIPLDAGKEFSVGRLEECISHLEYALVDVGLPLQADAVDVIVTPTDRPIPGWDINGYSLGAYRIMLGVVPTCFDDQKRPIEIQLRAVLAHELHHAMRSRGPGYGQTLGEALISEGLAQCYEEEIGCPTSNYATVLTKDQLREFARRAMDEHSNSSYDHSKWFYGKHGDPDFPWAGGYSLGYSLVSHWLKAEGRTASQAVVVAASSILPQAFELLERGYQPK